MDNRTIKNYLSNLQVEYLLGGCRIDDVDWFSIGLPAHNKFYFVTQGSCQITLENKTFQLSQNQLALIPEDIAHSFQKLSGENIERYWCYFKASTINIPLFSLLKTKLCINVDDPEYVKYLYDKINDPLEQSVTSILKKKSILLDLICYFLDRSNVEVNFKNECIKELNDVIIYIEQHLTDDLGLETLSKIAHLHPNYLIRKFKAHFGYSPGKYVNNIRLTKAREFLITTNLTIAEISHMTGFKDDSYFSSQFKKYIGISPNEFRKQLKQKGFE